MRSEYDFSQGKRGKHAGKRLRIVGDTGARNGPEIAARIQQIIERDLKSREDFDAVWSELSPTEREDIRAAWLKKISTVLADQPARSSRRA
jgi:hypothetical protein